MADERELSPKHLAFCEAYLRLWNGTRAYMEAYPGSSYEAAAVSASKLLRNPSVKAYIRRETEGALTAAETLAILGKRARDGSNKGVQVRALGLALKVHGLLLDRQEVKVEGVMSWKEQIERSRVEGEVGDIALRGAQGGTPAYDESDARRAEPREPREPSDIEKSIAGVITAGVEPQGEEGSGGLRGESPSVERRAEGEPSEPSSRRAAADRDMPNADTE